MKNILLTVVVLWCSFFWGQAFGETISGKYEKENGKINISQQDDSGRVKVVVTAWGGSAADCIIEGSVKVKNNRITLKDHGCTISIKIKGNTASIEEHDCMGYCGVGAYFSGKFKKVK